MVVVAGRVSRVRAVAGGVVRVCLVGLVVVVGDGELSQVVVRKIAGPIRRDELSDSARVIVSPRVGGQAGFTLIVVQAGQPPGGVVRLGRRGDQVGRGVEFAACVVQKTPAAVDCAVALYLLRS